MTAVGDGSGSNAVHDEPHHAWRPPRRVPLQLDQDEHIAGEQQRRPRDLAAARDPGFAKAGCVGFKTGLAKALERQPVALWLELRGRPKRHGEPPSTACAMPAPGITVLRSMGSASERPLCLTVWGLFFKCIMRSTARRPPQPASNTRPSKSRPRTQWWRRRSNIWRDSTNPTRERKRRRRGTANEAGSDEGKMPNVKFTPERIEQIKNLVSAASAARKSPN